MTPCSGPLRWNAVGFVSLREVRREVSALVGLSVRHLIVLLGVERLLLDLAESPLPRWLKTHAWLAEAFLTREKLSSPREEA